MGGLPQEAKSALRALLEALKADLPTTLEPSHVTCMPSRTFYLRTSCNFQKYLRFHFPILDFSFVFYNLADALSKLCNNLLTSSCCSTKINIFSSILRPTNTLLKKALCTKFHTKCSNLKVKFQLFLAVFWCFWSFFAHFSMIFSVFQ